LKRKLKYNLSLKSLFLEFYSFDESIVVIIKLQVSIFFSFQDFFSASNSTFGEVVEDHFQRSLTDLILQKTPVVLLFAFHESIHISETVLIWRNSHLEELFTVALQDLNQLELVLVHLYYFLSDFECVQGGHELLSCDY